MSASVIVFVRRSKFGGQAKLKLSLDRVPVIGDYIHIGGSNIAKVNAVILLNDGAAASAYVYADHDPDDIPDELQ